MTRQTPPDMPEDVRREVFPDHEVCHPPHVLKKALSTAGRGAAMDLRAIARAERALAALAVEFAAWMHNEITVLDTARRIVHETGLDDETRPALFRAAHDIKGEAATFGFPLAGRIAGSLCALIEGIGPHEAVSLRLVDQHVDAIRAVVREDARGEDDPTALLLARRLDEAVEAAVRTGEISARAS